MKKGTKFLISGGLILGLIGACSNNEMVEETNKELNTIEEKEEKDISYSEVQNVSNVNDIETDELTYRTNLLNSTEKIPNVLYELSDLMLRAGDNPYLIYEEDWVMDFSIQIVMLEQYVNEAKALEVPVSLKEEHEKVILAMNEYQFVVDNLPKAIDNMDVSLMNECTNAMNNATNYIKEATNMMEEKI